MLPIIGNSSLRLSGSLPHWALPTQATSCDVRRNGAAPTSTRRTAMQSNSPLHALQRAMQTIALGKPVAHRNGMIKLRSFDRSQSALPGRGSAARAPGVASLLITFAGARFRRCRTLDFIRRADCPERVASRPRNRLPKRMIHTTNVGCPSVRVAICGPLVLRANIVCDDSWSSSVPSMQNFL